MLVHEALSCSVLLVHEAFSCLVPNLLLAETEATYADLMMGPHERIAELVPNLPLAHTI
jgi:hypothetical protein